jgi:hypothetical protein
MRSLEKCYQMAQFFRTQKVSLRRRPGTSTGVEMSSEISGRRPASAGFGSKRPPNRLMDRFPGLKRERYSPGFSQLSDWCLQFAANWTSFGERSSPARTAIRARVWDVSNLLTRCGVPRVYLNDGGRGQGVANRQIPFASVLLPGGQFVGGFLVRVGQNLFAVMLGVDKVALGGDLRFSPFGGGLSFVGF